MDKGIEYNRRSHDRIYEKYECNHKEIYNHIEQMRLNNELAEAKRCIRTDEREVYKALDYGCGAGNLSRHLMELGFCVTAVDISEKFLELVKNRLGNGIHTQIINGSDLNNIPSETFDLVSTYSVLHHVPDYLFCVKELCRVLKQGGILYLDHEMAPTYWGNIELINDYKKKATTLKGKIKKYLRPRNYLNKVISVVLDPKYSEEGDIHVFKDDHIQWDEITRVLQEMNFKIIKFESFLCFNGFYKEEIYNAHKDKIADMAFLVAVKNSEKV